APGHGRPTTVPELRARRRLGDLGSGGRQRVTRFHEAQPGVLDRMDEAHNYNAWLLDRARPHLGRRVLDLGAGIGTFSSALAADGRDVVAVEPDPALTPLLRERLAGRGSAVVLDEPLEALLPDAVGGPVDAIVCFNVL